MGKIHDEIPGNIIPWIQKQKLFWVATSPLAEDGHVNVSPKGGDKSLHVLIAPNGDQDSDEDLVEPGKDTNFKKVTSKTVWYEDLTGSGVETIAHLRENGRITLMLSAFEGPPMIVRLFGTGRVYEFGTPEYDRLLPSHKRQPGSRSVVWIDVHKVGTSCGFAVPFYTYKGPRHKLHRYSCRIEQGEYNKRHNVTEGDGDNPLPLVDGVVIPENGLKDYWKTVNAKSLDGLPGVLSAHEAEASLGDWRVRGAEYDFDDDESEPLEAQGPGLGGASMSKRLVNRPSKTALFGLGVGFAAVLGRVVFPTLISQSMVGLVAYGMLMVKVLLGN